MFKSIPVCCTHKFVSLASWLLVHPPLGGCLLVASCLDSVSLSVYFWNKKVCIVNKGTVSQALAPTVLIGEARAKQQMPLPFREPGMYLKAFGIKGVCVRIVVIIVIKGKGPACRLWNFKSNTTNIPSSAKYAPLKASWQMPFLGWSCSPGFLLAGESKWGPRPRGGVPRA